MMDAKLVCKSDAEYQRIWLEGKKKSNQFGILTL
jgi:hypothetical protein